MNTIIFISGLISLISLICFFVLCKNVKEIKLQTTKPEAEEFDKRVKILQAVGNQEKAKEVFSEEMVKLCAKYLARYREDEGRAWAIILAKYGEIAESLGYKITIPQEIIEAEKSIKAESLALGKVVDGIYDGQLIFDQYAETIARAKTEDNLLYAINSNGLYHTIKKQDVIAIDLTTI